MKKSTFLRYLILVTLLNMPIVAFAGKTVICTIDVHEDVARNVKSKRYSVGLWVRNNEARRLLNSGPYAAVVRYDRGSYCKIAHRENARYSWRVYKPSMKLDPAGRIPNCLDFTMVTDCYRLR